MTKTLLIIFALISVSAQAAQTGEGGDYPYSDDADRPNQVMLLTSADDNAVRCWGWDGSKGGNDIKTMSRSDCFGLHGTVAGHNIPAANATKQSINSQR